MNIRFSGIAEIQQHLLKAAHYQRWSYESSASGHAIEAQSRVDSYCDAAVSDPAFMKYLQNSDTYGQQKTLAYIQGNLYNLSFQQAFHPDFIPGNPIGQAPLNSCFAAISQKLLKKALEHPNLKHVTQQIAPLFETKFTRLINLPDYLLKMANNQ